MKPTFRIALCAIIFGTAAANAADDFPSEPKEVLYTEVTRRVVQLADHKVTYILVRPPTLPKRPATPPPAVVLPTAEEQATAERQAAKPCESLTLFATVYIGAPTVSQLTWWQDGRQFRAYSNVDWRCLDQLNQLETAETVYEFTPLMSTCELASLPEADRPPILAQLGFSDTEAEYLVEGTEADLAAAESSLRALDFIHGFYQLNKSELAAASAARELANAARERELKAHPPKPADVVIRFWPIQNGASR